VFADEPSLVAMGTPESMSRRLMRAPDCPNDLSRIEPADTLMQVN
jgi:hypothetical protein